jgi:hypothetical protein
VSEHVDENHVRAKIVYRVSHRSHSKWIRDLKEYLRAHSL